MNIEKKYKKAIVPAIASLIMVSAIGGYFAFADQSNSGNVISGNTTSPTSTPSQEVKTPDTTSNSQSNIGTVVVNNVHPTPAPEPTPVSTPQGNDNQTQAAPTVAPCQQ